MTSLLATIQGIVREELRALRTAELATVQEQHPHEDAGDADNYACTVALRSSGVVLRRVPVATGVIGAVSIPAVGELVLVQFLDGDVNAPVITGRLYSDEDRPPPSADGRAVLHLPLAAGDDEAVHGELHSAPERALVLKLGAGLALTLRDGDPVAELEVAGDTLLTVAKDGGVTLRSGGAVEVEGAQVTLKATGTLKLQGGTVEIN